MKSTGRKSIDLVKEKWMVYIWEALTELKKSNIDELQQSSSAEFTVEDFIKAMSPPFYGGDTTNINEAEKKMHITIERRLFLLFKVLEIMERHQAVNKAFAQQLMENNKEFANLRIEEFVEKCESKEITEEQKRAFLNDCANIKAISKQIMEKEFPLNEHQKKELSDNFKNFKKDMMGRQESLMQRENRRLKRHDIVRDIGAISLLAIAVVMLLDIIIAPFLVSAFVLLCHFMAFVGVSTLVAISIPIGFVAVGLTNDVPPHSSVQSEMMEQLNKAADVIKDVSSQMLIGATQKSIIDYGILYEMSKGKLTIAEKDLQGIIDLETADRLMNMLRRDENIDQKIQKSVENIYFKDETFLNKLVTIINDETLSSAVATFIQSKFDGLQEAMNKIDKQQEQAPTKDNLDKRDFEEMLSQVNEIGGTMEKVSKIMHGGGESKDSIGALKGMLTELQQEAQPGFSRA